MSVIRHLNTDLWPIFSRVYLISYYFIWRFKQSIKITGTSHLRVISNARRTCVILEQLQNDSCQYRSCFSPAANFGNSPVNADHTQGHDGGSAAHYIHADEDVAEHLPKQPLSPGEVCYYYKRHHKYGHGQVRHSKGHQKVV